MISTFSSLLQSLFAVIVAVFYFSLHNIFFTCSLDAISKSTFIMSGVQGSGYFHHACDNDNHKDNPPKGWVMVMANPLDDGNAAAKRVKKEVLECVFRLEEERSDSIKSKALSLKARNEQGWIIGEKVILQPPQRSCLFFR